MEPKGVLDVLDRGPLRTPLDADHVEAERTRTVAPTVDGRSGRRGDLPPLAPVDRHDRGDQRSFPSPLDLDQGDDPALLRDDVDLPSRSTPSARQDPVAPALQMGGGKRLAVLPQPGSLFGDPGAAARSAQRSISRPSAPRSTGACG